MALKSLMIAAAFSVNAKPVQSAVGFGRQLAEVRDGGLPLNGCGSQSALHVLQQLTEAGANAGHN